MEDSQSSYLKLEISGFQNKITVFIIVTFCSVFDANLVTFCSICKGFLVTFCKKYSSTNMEKMTKSPLFFMEKMTKSPQKKYGKNDKLLFNKLKINIFAAQ